MRKILLALMFVSLPVVAQPQTVTTTAVQTISGAKTFNANKMIHAGSTSGTTILNAAAIAGSGTVVLPTTGTLSTLAGTEALTNKTYNGNSWTAGTGVLTLGAGKTATISNTLTFAGTDGSSVAFGTGGTVLYTSASRELITSTRSYYVRADGSDSNTGLVNSAGGAFLTVQKALNVVRTSLNLAADVMINVGAGTFAGAYVYPWTGSGDVYLIGDTTTPGNVILTNNTLDTHAVSMPFAAPGWFWLRGFKLTTTTAGHAISTGSHGAHIGFGNIEFGAVAVPYSHVLSYSGEIVNTNNYTISAGAHAHLNVALAGHINIQGFTTTLTGTPAFDEFALADDAGTIHVISETFTGAATGLRFLATNGGILSTTGSATYLPGNAAGVTNNGGLYLGSGVTDRGVLQPYSGGTGLDTSGSTGVPIITAGTWAVNTTLPCAQEPAFTGDISKSAASCATAIGATKVTSAMLNSDVFSTAHSWGGTQTLTSPIITNMAPGADFTLSQNSVVPVTSVNSGAVVNTLYLKTGLVGIGTTAPDSQITISGNAASPPALSGSLLHVVAADAASGIISFDTFAANGTMAFRRANGTNASPTTLVTDNIIGQFGFRGHDGTAYSAGNAATIRAFAANTWTTGDHSTYLTFSTTPVGSITVAEQMRIDAGGVVTLQSSIVTKNYTVASLPTTAATGKVTGARVHITDQLTTCAGIGVALTGGGAVVCPAFYNGVAWVGG